VRHAGWETRKGIPHSRRSLPLLATRTSSVLDKMASQ
jgi:hypothetical protein